MHPVSLKSILKNTLKKMNIYDIYRRQRALVIWERVCGKEVARISKAVKLRGGVLTVAVIDHIWATELSNFTYQYLRKYSRHLGEKAVVQIRFKVNPQTFVTPQKAKKEDFELSAEITQKEIIEIEEIIKEIKDEKAQELIARFMVNKKKHDRWLRDQGGDRCFGCKVMLEKGETFCPHCMLELKRVNAQKLRKKLEETPWVSYDEISKTLKPLTRDLYEHVKRSLKKTYYHQIIESIEKTKKVSQNKKDNITEIKINILTYAMLCSCKKPAQMTDIMLSGILPRRMYKFYCRPIEDFQNL